MELVFAGVLMVAYGLVKDRMIREERDAWTRERRELLNRIKPETAVPIIPDNVHVFPAVDMFDDEDWHQAREERLNGAA